MHRIFAPFFTLLISLSALAAEYPMGPNPQLTPGALCQNPDSRRYPERIAYCKRNVSSNLKAEVFSTYRKKLGFRLDLTNRQNYKIDHYIPLCAGGSNVKANLWPQHISIFTITDPLEAIGCEKLSLGKIRQDELIRMIKQAKNDLKTVPDVIEDLQNM